VTKSTPKSPSCERPQNRCFPNTARALLDLELVTAPIFLLVPQIRLPKRLDLDRDAVRARDSVPGLIVANWVQKRIR